MNKLFILFIFLISFPALAKSYETVFSQNPWPPITNCNQCVTLEFLDLRLSIPPHRLKRIKMLNMNGIAFALDAEHKWLKTEGELIVLLLNESDTTGGLNENGFYEKLQVSNLTGFFKALHQKTFATKDLKTARKIMGIDDSSEFIAYYGHTLSAFWIANNDRKNQSLYIVPAGKNHSLQISGNLSHTAVNILLSSIELSKKHNKKK